MGIEVLHIVSASTSVMECTTTKMKRCILFQGNKFTLCYEGKIKKSCRCTTKKCTARIHTTGEENTIEEATVQHNHDQKVSNVMGTILKSRCKRKAEDEFHQQPSKVLKLELNVLDET